jgi:GntR family transcriptional regulator
MKYGVSRIKEETGVENSRRFSRLGPRGVMVKWFIDKDNKVPLYLQVKDLIKYYISTGAIQDNHRLPTVNELAGMLEVNFETIRKAYKELEREGFISTQRGKGSFTAAHAHAHALAGAKSKGSSREHLIGSLRESIAGLLSSGLDASEIRAAVEEAIERSSLESRMIVFTECNSLQADEISQLLQDYLGVYVKPVLLDDLRDQVAAAYRSEKTLLAVVTTGFHVSEVRNRLSDMPIKIDFLITNMSPDTRRELDTIDKKSRFVFICRDQSSIAFYREMLKAELALESDVACRTFDQLCDMNGFLSSADVCLVSPPVYEEVKKLAPPDLPVYNVFNRVDPMSLKVIKESIGQM